MNARRRVLASLAAGALTGAFPAAAQRARHRIAWISPTKAVDGSPFLDELRRGLRELGYVEGRDIAIEVRWGEDSPERTTAMIAEVVASQPELVVAQGATALLMRRATAAIPVAFAYSGDPVAAGLVQSLARPGGNMTGISFLALDLVGKRIELVKELVPAAKRIAVVAQPQHPGDAAERRASEAAARALGIEIVYYESRNTAQLIEVLAAIEKSRSDAVVMFPVQNIVLNRERIAAWALKARVPAVSGWAQFAEGGNLLSYGPNLREASRRLAFYVDRILKGANPADLPVELPAQVELVVNLKAARALGIAVPSNVLLRAQRVIE